MNTIGNAEEFWLFLIGLAFSSLLLLIQLGELGGGGGGGFQIICY